MRPWMIFLPGIPSRTCGSPPPGLRAGTATRRTGKETAGLPPALLQRYPERCVRLPMREEARSLNLANTVAAVTYEALRQLDFPGLIQDGHRAWEEQKACAIRR